MRMKLGIGLVVTVALCCGAMPASGDWVTPVAVWDHSSPSNLDKTNMIDGDQSTYYQLGDDDPTETEHCTNYVILDLGDTYTVEGFKFLPRIHATASTGPEELDIFYQLNEALMPVDGYKPNVTSTLASDSNVIIAASRTLPAIHGEGEFYETTFSAGETFQARYVGLWTRSSYDGGSDGQNTLAEVQFNVIPEPAMLSLLAAGGFLAVLRKRR